MERLLMAFSEKRNQSVLRNKHMAQSCLTPERQRRGFSLASCKAEGRSIWFREPKERLP